MIYGHLPRIVTNEKDSIDGMMHYLYVTGINGPMLFL